jgi:hypothetical protein
VKLLFTADIRSLAAVRVGVALILLMDFCQRLTDLEAHYSDFGVTPRSLVIETAGNRWLVSLHFLSGAWQLQGLLILLAGAFAVALLIGYRTRLATAGTLILLVSLHARNPYVLQGGDLLLRLVVFWALFLPWGACFSVDRALSDPSEDVAKQTASAGALAYAAQIVVVYWFSVLQKSGAEWWSQGSAVYYALNIDYMVTPLGDLLLKLPYGALKLATWAVLGFEAIGPVLLFSPWYSGPVRCFAVFGFIVMHLVFLSTLFVGMFPLVGIISILFFLPSWFWDDLLPQIAPRRAALNIEVNANCDFCRKSVRLAKTFLLGPQTQTLQVGPDSGPAAAGCVHSWAVIDQTGRSFSGYQAAAIVARSRFFLAWLAPILEWRPVQRCAERVYCLVAARSDLRRPRGLEIAAAGAKLPLSRGESFLALALLVYMVAWNLSNLPYWPLKLSERARSLGYWTGLYQTWELFAPFPVKDDGWYVIPGSLSDGRRVDLFRGGAEIDWRKPRYVALTFRNNRWRKYFEQLRRRELLGPAYAAYLCREWNRRHEPSEFLESLEIFYVLEWTRPHFERAEPRRMRLLRYPCPPPPKGPGSGI